MRKPSRVFLEWDKLVFDHERPPEVKEPEWRALYESCSADGDWSVDEFDAGLVTSLGVTLMLQLSRWNEATLLLEEFMRHPGWPGLEQSDCVTWCGMTNRLGQSMLLEGRTAEALSQFDKILATQGPVPQSTRRHLIRNSIVQLCEASPNEVEHAVRELKQLSHRILSQWTGHKRKAPFALSVTSVSELFELLESTYPSRNR